MLIKLVTEVTIEVNEDEMDLSEGINISEGFEKGHASIVEINSVAVLPETDEVIDLGDLDMDTAKTAFMFGAKLGEEA